MNNTWMDVTTIMGWLRPAVGIIRTEAECAHFALSLISSNKPIKFCVYDNTHGYREVDQTAVVVCLNRISGRDFSKTEFVPSTGGSPDQPKIKKIVLQLLDKSPRRVRAHLYLYLQRRRSAALDGLTAFRSLLDAVKRFVKPSSNFIYPLVQDSTPDPKNIAHPFSDGDTYVSMGLDWDQKDLVVLYKIKKMASLKVVLFCYDVIPVSHPQLCVGDVSAKFANYFSKVAWCANTVLCISECSKRDLVALLREIGAPIPDMKVIKLGCQLPVANLEKVSPHVIPFQNERFLLFVSTIERRKNHEVLYRAYTRLVDAGVQNLPKLVFVGMPGWGVSELLSDLNLDPRMKGRYHILNNIDDDTLCWLYKNCWFTVFPSLYEGWGLPVVESLAAGKFCLASSAASLPEAGGDYIEYLDPWDVQAWALKLKDYIQRPSLIESRQARIVAEFDITTWNETARSVFGAIDDSDARNLC